MRQFRLIFRRETTILERQLNSGACYVQEIYPDRVERDAKLLDQLLNDLGKDNMLIDNTFSVEA